MATFDAGTIQATATLDRTPFQRSLEAAIREGKSFDGTTYTAIADVDYRQVDRKVSLAKAKLEQFAGNKYTAKLDADRSGVTRAVEAAQRDLGRTGGKDVKIRADLDTSPILQKLQQIEQASNRTADSIGSGFTSQFQKIKFTAIFGGIALGAAAAGPSLIGLAGGFGAAALSAQGLGEALKAYSTEQKNSDKVSTAGASSARSNAIAIRNAQQSIEDARRSAGRAAEDSQERIRNASRQEVQAAHDVVIAQEGITRARKEATRALQDAQEKVRDFSLDLNGALLAERRAAEDLSKTMMDSASTDLDKAEAQQRLAEAVERVSDLNKEHARNLQDLDQLQKQGVEGSDQVVSAKDQEAAAEDRLKQSMHEADLAQRDAARSQEDSARTVERALQALADVQAQQADSAAAAAAKNDAFADAMAKLSPAGQMVVRTLLSLKDNYDRLKSESQGAIFPGLNRFLEALPSIEPAVTGGFKAIGKSISEVGDHASETIKNPLFQGQLEQALKNGAPVVKAVGNAVIDLGADFVRFGSTSTDIVSGVVDTIGSLENGVNRFFTNLQPQSRAAGETFSSFGQIVEDALGGAGTLVGQFVSAWANVRGEVEPVVREVIDVFTQFTGGGFQSFSDDMKIVLDVVNAALHVVQPFVAVLGGIAGDVLAANLAFKLFAGPVGKIVELFGKFKPATVAASITSALPAFARVGTEVDKATGKITKNTDGLSKNQIAWGKVGTKVADAGKYIPIIGLAIAGISEVINQAVPDLDNLAQGLLDGGQAGATAGKQISDISTGVVNFSTVMNAAFGNSVNDVAKKARDLYDAMTPLQQAQQRNTKAANDYQYALQHFGEQSIVTREAAEKYRTTTADVEQAQWKAEEATKSHTEKIRDQQDAMLNTEGSQISYERAQIRIKEAQDALNTAISEHGPKSREAQQAELDLRQAMLDSITAAGALADSQTALLDPATRLKEHTYAVNDQLVTLATQAGTALPPELQKLINKMSDSELAAYGVKVEVDKMGNKILSLPPGKRLEFPTDAQRAADGINNLAGAVDRTANAYKHWMDNYIGLITAINNDPLTVNESPAGFGFLGHRAMGGPMVPGQPTIVGERGPELVFPDRASFVATAQQTKAIQSGWEQAGQYGGTTVDNSSVVAAIMMLIDLLSGGVRAEFDSGSLETGLIRAGRRRDTR